MSEHKASISRDHLTPDSNQGPTPTTDPNALQQDIPTLQRGFFEAVTTEPNTAVGLISMEGQVIYLNDQAAKLFHGPVATAAQFVGRYWSDHMPEDWVAERLAIFRDIAVHGRSVLMRTIWRGFQHLTWIHHIAPEPGENPTDLFLTITRRAANDQEAEKLTPTDHEVIDSGVMRLGPLDTLSTRELEVLALIGQGLSAKEAAKVLFRSESTVQGHCESIHKKLDIHNRVDLSDIARRAGLTVADAARTRV